MHLLDFRYVRSLRNWSPGVDKMLYRRETVLQSASYFSPKGEDSNWEIIFYWHYRSIFNHCDIISPKIYQIRWKNAK